MKETAPSDILRNLVHVNSQRIRDYHKAIQETDEEYLRALFIEFQLTSHSIQSKLFREIEILGVSVEQVPNPPMYLSNNVSVFKTALAGMNRDAILNSCEYTEVATEDAYKSVMTFSIYGCTVPLQSSIRNQHTMLTNDYTRLKSLREMIVVIKRV